MSHTCKYAHTGTLVIYHAAANHIGPGAAYSEVYLSETGCPTCDIAGI